MKKLLLQICFLMMIQGVYAQIDTPIWDIGTKWTYELINPPNSTSYVTNEIVDTVIIDNLKLYAVSSEPVFTGINYFHYMENKVYNYDPTTQILQLLYDFEEGSSYETEYRPICDPSFDYDSLVSQTYTIEIDSVRIVQFPNGLEAQIQYADREVKRRILKNIGFLEGYIHHTHDWEIGVLICDELANFVTKLRCFENDTVSYNFQDYPCDSTWVTTSTNDGVTLSSAEVYPNPSNGVIQFKNLNQPVEYSIYNNVGECYETGIYDNGYLQLQYEGLNIIMISLNGDTKSYKVLKINDFR